MKINDSSYTQFFKKLVKLFKKLEIEYMILGGASALIQGFNNITQDVDLYIDKNKDNQTMSRWIKNEKRTLEEILNRGII